MILKQKQLIVRECEEGIRIWVPTQQTTKGIKRKDLFPGRWSAEARSKPQSWKRHHAGKGAPRGRERVSKGVGVGKPGSLRKSWSMGDVRRAGQIVQEGAFFFLVLEQFCNAWYLPLGFCCPSNDRQTPHCPNTRGSPKGDG